MVLLPGSSPKKIDIRDSQIERAMQLGGTISIPDLRTYKGSHLDFLSERGFNCAHLASIDFRGESTGSLLISYRESKDLSPLQSDMLEEFTRSAAVAIANAKSQTKLARYTGRLEELVEERTADLAVQTARADEANRAKSQFVANMSHELRSPLTAIVGYSSVISEGIFGEINEQQADGLKAIQRAAEHLKELINDVLDVSKIEAGKNDPQPAEVSVGDLLQQVFKLMQQSAMGKGLQFKSVPKDAQELIAWIDPRHIRQILINLTSNAIKYTPSGGTVSLHFEQIGDKAKITIEDTGVGLTQAEQTSIFERYTRTDHDYSQAQVGTGIGLSLTKHLIEINGGLIGVDSEIGKGSSFWILAPLVADQQEAIEHIISVEDGVKDPLSRLDGLNILVVDDNRWTCEVLSTIITSVGGTAHIAHSVPEAKELIETIELDTALVDLAIPGESGIDLLQFLRKQCNEPLSTMPIIVVSACVFERDKENALEHGATTFVAKPFFPSEIVNTIRELTLSSALDPQFTSQISVNRKSEGP